MYRCCPRARPFRILYPFGNDDLRSLTSVRGIGFPGAPVTVRVANFPPAVLTTAADGTWTVLFTRTLPPGLHFIYAQTVRRGRVWCDRIIFRILPDPNPVLAEPE